jgi:DMSO/TMAO reductase YedYZ molybdopterin-dependent catalytic subunit
VIQTTTACERPIVLQRTNRSQRVIGALAGVMAAVVALGVAELVAGARPTWRSPVLDVGDVVIDHVPVSVKNFAVEQFGTKDKPVLLLGIAIVLTGYAAAVGALAFRRRLAAGVAGITAFGVIGVIASRSRRTAGPWLNVVPTVAGAVFGIGALCAARWLLADRRPLGAVDTQQTADSPQPMCTRRQLLGRSVTVLGLLGVAGGAAGAAGRALRSRFSAGESRAAVRLPRPAAPAPGMPPGVAVDVDGVAPFVTPNKDFYRIDTALTVPQLRTEDYELRVTGMVDRELRLSFDDLLARNVVEHDITLTCVSNTVGGELIGHARWLGVRLDELLAEAGLQPGADQVVGRSVDGYTCGFPVEAATDGRNALVAFGMNGEPLPLEHGFPARLVVPGLYGYISATKWLVEIEITRFDRFEQYWVPRGYADRAPIKLMSRIDSVDGLGNLTRNADGVAAIGGVAWAQTRGISAVEVQIDDGPWAPAEMGDALNDDSWRQWAYRWTPANTGRTSLRCRAIDGDGVIQTDERTEPLPNGASGHHQIVVFVS